MSKKTKNKIRITFPWYNSEEVTGSAVLISLSNNKKILVEFGMYQGQHSLLEDYRANSKRLSFNAKDLDYVIVCHSHCDHVGMIPRLAKENFSGKILAPDGLKELYETMCLDSAFILERNAESLTKKFGKEFLPIYDKDDVYNSLNFWNEYQRNELIKIDEDLEIKFIPSGHIYGSTQVLLYITNNGKKSSILVTSDLGNTSVEQLYIDPFEKVEKANIIIGECTYCDPSRKRNSKKDREKDLEKLETIIRQTTVDNKGKILIPSFSLQRTQQIITYIYQLFKNDENFNIPIIMDSKLATRVNEIFQQKLKGKDKELFEEVLNWKNIKILNEFADTQYWARDQEKPCIFVSSSGMLVGGRSVWTAAELLPNPKNCIIFVGYSSENSLASKIKNRKQKTITIDGRPVPARCGVINLNSMSSHMQYNDLINYYSSINCEKLLLLHGDQKMKIDFAKVLQEEVTKKNKTSKIIATSKSTEVLL